MALTDLTRISTSGIATGSSLSGAILHGDAHFRGPQVGVTSALFDSSENELNFKDNVKLTFGDRTNGDLQVYHNGSDNYIDAITGSLYFRNTLPTNTIFQTGNFVIKNQSNNQDVANFAPGANGGGKIYHENALRFNTTSTGAVVTGILTATSFSGPILGSPINNPSGISTFYNVRVTNNLTVEGSTTTLDTDLTAVDRVEVGADSDTIVGVAITQSGTADILKLVGSTDAVTIKKNGRIGIGTITPLAGLHISDGTSYGTPQITNQKAQLVISAGTETSANIQLLASSYNHIFFGKSSDANAGTIVFHHTGSYTNAFQISNGGAQSFLRHTGTVDIRSATAEGNSFMQSFLVRDSGNTAQYQIGMYENSSQHLYFNNFKGNTVFAHGASNHVTFESNGQVGIGTNLTNPSFKLDVREAHAIAYAANATSAQLGIGNINSSAATNSSGIHMYSDGNGRGVVNLNCLNNSTSSSADFTIQTRHSGTLYERFRIMSNGDIVWHGTGTATPGVSNSTVGMGFEPRNGTIFLSRGDNATLLSNRNNDGRHIHFAQGGTQKFAIGLQSSGADLTFNSGAGVSPTETVRFAANGTVGIGGTSIPGALLDLSAAVPAILFSETGVSANNGKWLNAANGSELYWQAQTDGHSGGGNLFKMTRNNQQIHSFEAQQAGVSWFSIRNTDKKVGIGTYAPSETLHVMGSAKFTNAGLQTHFRSTTTQFDVRQTNYDGWTHMTYPTHPIIKWNWMSGPGDHLYLASGGNTGVSTQMAMLISDSHGVKIGRSGWDGGNGTDLGTEYVRINTSGRVDIASNNYSSGHVDTKLRVGTESGSNQATVVIGSADQDVPALIITNWDGSATTNKNVIRFDNSGRGTYEIGGVGGSNEFGIFIDNFTTPKLKINSAGNATITDGNLSFASGHGINFSSTSDPGGMASELFDDYEEGSWTPDPNFATTGSADETALPDGGIQGQYVKIGRLVYYTFSINFSGRDSSASGNFYVSGLPYSVSNTYWNEESGFPSAYYSGITNATSQPSTQPSASGRLYFAMTDGTGNHSGNTYLNHNHIGTGHVRIRGGGIYRTAT